MENNDEEIQEKDEISKNEEKITNPGKKLSWYIAYPILLILISISVWMIYRAINIGKTKEVALIIEISS